MRYTKTFWLTGLFILSLVLSACNLGKQPEPTPDVGAIYTAAAQTMLAQYSTGLTQTAQAVPPTATALPTTTFGSPASPLATPLGGTPLATITPLAALVTSAGTVCNDSIFMGVENYEDGSTVKANQQIAKFWRVKNTGTCTWDDGYYLQHYAGESLDAENWIITLTSQFVEPGEEVDITVQMTTPSKKGEHGGCWKMIGDDGYFFGTPLCIEVIVE